MPTLSDDVYRMSPESMVIVPPFHRQGGIGKGSFLFVLVRRLAVERRADAGHDLVPIAEAALAE